MNEMKPEDVMRALECCAEEHCGEWCPFYYETPCEAYLAKAALALLREKDAEIERLKEQQKRIDEGFDEVIRASAQEVEGWKRHFESYYETTKETIRAEAITEFAERIVKAIHPEYPLSVCQVYQIAKELKGANDDTVSKSKD
jgi:exonuclease VII large subunit